MRRRNTRQCDERAVKAEHMDLNTQEQEGEQIRSGVESTACKVASKGHSHITVTLPADTDVTACVSVHQDELKLALKQGTTLLGCIKEQAAKSEDHKLNPDEMENQTTVER